MFFSMSNAITAGAEFKVTHCRPHLVGTIDVMDEMRHGHTHRDEQAGVQMGNTNTNTHTGTVGSTTAPRFLHAKYRDLKREIQYSIFSESLLGDASTTKIVT